MRKGIILLALLLTCLMTYGQGRVHVLLKSGEKLEARSLELLPEGLLLLQYKNAERQLSLEEVSGIYYGTPRLSDTEEKNTHFRQEKGFYNHTELQWLHARDPEGEHSSNVSIQTVNGFAFSRYLMPGLGIGIDHYSGYTFTPVYAHVRGLLLDRNISPYYYGSVGWGLMWNPAENNPWLSYDEARGGMMWQAGMGLQFNLETSAITLGIGLRQQQALLEYSYTGFDFSRSFMPMNNIDVDEARLMRRLTINLGFTF